MSARRCAASLLATLALLSPVAWCTTRVVAPAAAAPDVTLATPWTRSGREVYASFRAGLADPLCEPGASARWRRHFAHVPRQLAGNNDVLPLFGYVVDALRAAHLPTEYALIPFVESGYKPGARSASGPAGLWQFIAVTARNHRIPIRSGYDGRLSPVDSTQAAVRYLKTLHGMFAGDWRLAVMAYNAGEYRVFGALKRHGQHAMGADPAQLTSLSDITQSYVRKLHALSCLLDEADDREDWLRSLDRPMPRLADVELPRDAENLDSWSVRQGQDPAMVRRLNPAFADGRVARTEHAMRVLASAESATTTGMPADATQAAPATASAQRTHTVARGESASRIAQRHGITLRTLLERNGLDVRSILRPGMVLKLDATPVAGVTEAAVAN